MKYTLKKDFEATKYNMKNFINTMEHFRELIHSTLDFDELMNRLIVVASKSINCKTAYISIREEDAWIVRYIYGLKEDIRGAVMNDNEEWHAVLAINAKKPVIINDAFNDYRVNREHMIKCGIRSVIVVPFIRKEFVVGVAFFNFYKKIEVFNNFTIEFVNSLAESISMALNNVNLYQLTCTELEERKKAVKKYKLLFDSIDEGFSIVQMIFNSEGKAINYRFIETNSAFEKQTGLYNVEGKLICDLLPENEECWFDIYGKVALDGEPIRFINETKALNRWFSVYAFKIDTGNIGTLFRDITCEIISKKELQRSLEIQDEVFANISHELKTPLNVIFSTNQLMNLYLQNESLVSNKGKLLKSVNIINQNCYRFTKLINNIVDISKIDSGFFKLNISNVNIIEITEDIVQSVSEYIEGKGINIIFDTNIEEYIIAVDPDKIERIILNLISNALKFTNDGGTIFVNLVGKDEWVEISVRDTGIGIDKNSFDKIFKRFYQVDKSLSRNAEGIGIGLSLVKSLVKLHGGNISVDSKVGEGSIFKIELPKKLVKNPQITEQIEAMNSKIEMINIEFSDIYQYNN